MSTDNMERISWGDVYLLGYVDCLGTRNLTSWRWTGLDPEPFVYVVVVGQDPPPLWNAAVKPEAVVYLVPQGASAEELAREHGGLVAFGWHLPGQVERREWKP